VEARVTRARIGPIVQWIITLLAALAFVSVGAGKFRSPFWIAAFPRWGYNDGFRILIGVLEIAGGLLLAVPSTAVYAAILIDTIMVGAVATLAAHHEKLFPPIFWIVIISSIGYARRRRP
jgi:uncharacterized membrane protein YphA (DoxX/SURF4 family)